MMRQPVQAWISHIASNLRNSPLLCILSLLSTSSAHAASHSQLANLAARQDNGAVSPDTFLRRAYHSSVVAGNRVYIDGGEFSASDTVGDIYYAYSSHLLSIDLSKNWTNSTVVIESSSKPSGVPSLVYGGLWHDDSANKLYTGFAGRTSWFNSTPYSPDQDETSIWSFTPDGVGGGDWETVMAPRSEGLQSIGMPSYCAIASGAGKGYALSGQVSPPPGPFNDSSAVNVAGMLEFDFGGQTVRNTSVEGPRWHGNIQLASMLYVPNFGAAGVFLVFGGDRLHANPPAHPANTIDDLVPWGVVSVFDPAPGKWFDQVTGGNVPAARKEFCVTGVASDSGSFEVFLYAGWGGSLGPGSASFDEIYVLTLPAFHWIKVGYQPVETRHGHTCHAVGGSQILVIGGLNTSSNAPNGTGLYKGAFWGKDRFEQGLGVFDLARLEWADRYTADAGPYVQGDTVRAIYAQKNQDVQWNSTELKSVFDVRNFTTNNDTTSNNTTSSNTSGNGDQSQSSLSSGSIAGVAVGSVAGLAIIAGALVFAYLRKRRRERDRAPPPSHEKPRYLHEAEGNQFVELQGSSARGELEGTKKDSAHEMDGRALAAELPT